MWALREEKTTRNFAPWLRQGIREFLRARRKHTEFDFRRLTCVSCLWQATPKGREFIPRYCSFLPTGLSVPCLCSNHLGFRPGRSPSRSLRGRTKGTLDALREKRPPCKLCFGPTGRLRRVLSLWDTRIPKLNLSEPFDRSKKEHTKIK